VEVLADAGALAIGRFEHRLPQLLRLNRRPTQSRDEQSNDRRTDDQ
jgi:hypothetical protein